MPQDQTHGASFREDASVRKVNEAGRHPHACVWCVCMCECVWCVVCGVLYLCVRSKTKLINAFETKQDKLPTSLPDGLIRPDRGAIPHEP